MFDTRKFGRYLSKLRKTADMTQSEFADKLNITRQAVSRYEPTAKLDPTAKGGMYAEMYSRQSLGYV